MMHITALALVFAGPFSSVSQTVSQEPAGGVQEAPAPADARAAATQVRLTIPVEQLVFEGDAPSRRRTAWMESELGPALLPRVIVPGWEATVELPPMTGRGLSFGKLYEGSIALLGAVPTSELRGELLLPNDFGNELLSYAFTVPASAALESDSRWREIKASYYRALSGAALPGTAWFRRRAEAFVHSTEPVPSWSDGKAYSVGDTFAMFSGGRALAENLALKDVIGSDDERRRASKDITELEGVTTPLLDFGPLVAGVDVKLDALSYVIPFDQHAVFFPSFASLLRVADQLKSDSAPLVQFFDGRSQDTRIRERYERQMCLELSALARTFGSQFVESVALTGSDTYLRTGSDVAIVFQGSVPAIRGMLQAKIEAAAEEWGLEPTELGMSGTPVLSAVSPGRELSVYLGAMDGVVIVSNSVVQMRRLLQTIEGHVQSLKSLDEYRWFRERYPLAGEGGAEDAFAVLSDATIRRWASPHWRIATSRRTKAAAVLADADAWRLGNAMGLFAADEGRLLSDVPGGGAISYDWGTAVDETYGSLSFLTPIAELEIDHVTEAESQGYEQWRRGYERAWTASFDPIAIQLDVTEGSLDMDLSLVPLIVRTDYRDLIDWTGTATLGPDVGDFHSEAIFHWAAAIDRKGRSFLELSSLASAFGAKGAGLGWVGDHVAVYMDRDDEYFAKLQDADTLDSITEEMLPGLPIGVEIGVSRPIALAAFLTSLRGMINDAVPGMMEYEAREYAGVKFVAIVPAPGSMFTETPTIYYVVHPKALVVSFSEKVIHGSIDRAKARQALEAEPMEDPADEAGSAEVAPWIDASSGLYVGPWFQNALAVNLFKLEARDQMQGRSWANLAILNEWKAAGKSDPVQYHEDEWGVRLVCPGGGEYVWNDAFQTMESTVFGHPAEPKSGPNLPPALKGLKGITGALTFDRIGEGAARGLRVHLKLRH